MSKRASADIAAVILLGIVIYLHSLPAPFHLDDFPHLVDNPHIKNLADPAAVWNHWPSRFFGFFTFALNYSIGRLRPEGYRALNIAIHLAGGVLAYFLARRLAELFGRDEEPARRIALWTALVFVCHPVQVQAVTYIVQRFASLAGVLTLGSILCYLSARSVVDRGGDFRSRRHLLPYLLGLLLALLAMNSKESAVVIPVLILSLELLRPRRDVALGRRICYFLPYGLTVLVVPALSLYMASGRGTNPFYYRMNVGDGGRMYVVAQDAFVESRVQYLLTQFHALLVYFRLCLFPVRQSIYYDLPVSRSVFSPGTYPALLAVSALLLAALRSLRRQPLVSLAILWFFINLLPTSSVAVVWPFVSEHHLYLPLFSWALALGVLLGGLGEGAGRARAKLLGWLLVFTLAFLTIRRNQVWGSTYRLWADALRSAPDSPNVHNALAGALVGEGRYEEGAQSALRAMEINPRLNAYHNLWAAYFNQGDLPAAEAAARRHGELFPGDNRAGINLGMALLKGKEFAAAREVLRETASRYPDLSLARYWLGVSLFELGEDDAAIGEFNRAVELNPDYPLAYDYLGRLYQRRGEGGRALEIYSRGAEISPDSLVLNYNLGMLAWREGDPGLAEAGLRRALELAGDEMTRGMIESALDKLRSPRQP